MGIVSAFAIKPTLVGKLVTLRPFVDADLPHLGEILSDPEVRMFTGSVNTSSQAHSGPRELTDRERAWYLSRNQQEDRLDLAVEDNATGRCVGEVVINEWEPENQICNFRTFIGPLGRGRGLGGEAISLLMDYVFENTDVFRVGLEVFAFNPRAQHVYEKAGFVTEGRKRAVLVFDGQRIDDIAMSLLRPDWEARRQTGQLDG